MTDLSQCNCPDYNCQNLGCVDPCYSPTCSSDWWKSAISCDLVVDPDYVGVLSGTLFTQVRECDNQKPTYVIDTDDNWVIDIHISVTGKIQPALCGWWCVSACLESMCGPKYFRFPRDSASPPTSYCCCLVETNQFTTEYEIRICIPAGIVDVDECGSPYVLTVIATLLSRDQMKQGDPCDPGTYLPLGVAGACEIPLITFYEGV
jgi:hypothetical protein